MYKDGQNNRNSNAQSSTATALDTMSTKRNIWCFTKIIFVFFRILLYFIKMCPPCPPYPSPLIIDILMYLCIYPYTQYMLALHLTCVPLSAGFELSSSPVGGWATPECGHCRLAGSWRPPGPALSWNKLPVAYWPPPAFAPPSRSASAPPRPVRD